MLALLAHQVDVKTQTGRDNVRFHLHFTSAACLIVIPNFPNRNFTFKFTASYHISLPLKPNKFSYTSDKQNSVRAYT